MESDQSTFDAEIVDKVARKIFEFRPFGWNEYENMIQLDQIAYRSTANKILKVLYDEGVLLKERP